MAERIEVIITGDSKDLKAACVGARNDIGGVTDAAKDNTVATDRNTAATDRNTAATNRSRKEHDKLKTSLINTAAGLKVAQGVFKMVKFPAMIAGAGEAVKAIDAVGASLVSMTGAVGPASGALVALPSLLSAGAEGALTFKLATNDLSQALAGNKKAIENLTPEAKVFLDTLKSYKGEVKTLRQEAQKGMFPGLTKGLKDANQNFGVLQKMVGDTGKSIGFLGERAGKLIGGKSFGQDMLKISGTNQRSIKDLGVGFLALGSAMRHVLVAADPFMKWMTGTAKGWGKQIEGAAKLGRENGKLALFLKHTRESMTVLGHVGGNLGKTLFQIGKAGRENGMSLWQMFDKTTKGWAKWTKSAEGQTKIADYFKATKPAFVEMGRLVADIAKDFAKMGANGNIAPLIHQIRVELLPALFDLLDSTTKSLGPALVDTITQIAKLFKDLGGSSGPLVKIVEFIGTAAKYASDLLSHNKALKDVLVWMLTLGGLYKILGIGKAIAGAKSLGKFLAADAAIENGVGVGVGTGTGKGKGKGKGKGDGKSGGGGGGGESPPPIAYGPTGDSDPKKPGKGGGFGKRVKGFFKGGGGLLAGITRGTAISSAILGGITLAEGGDARDAIHSADPLQLLGDKNPLRRQGPLERYSGGKGWGNAWHDLKGTLGFGGDDKPKAPDLAHWQNYMTQIGRTKTASKQVTDQITNDLKGMNGTARKNAGDTISALADAMVAKKQLPKKAADQIKAAVTASMRGMKDNAASEAGGMVDAVSGAIGSISGSLGSALRSLGVKNNPMAQTLGGLINGVNAIGRIMGQSPMGYADGGYIGSQGQAGRDNVPVMLGAGEAVLNRHQQPIVDAALRAIGEPGGLRGLFGRVNTPHYMARGGSVSGDTDVTPPFLAALANMSKSTGKSIYIQSGRRSLSEQANLYARYKAGTGNLAAPPNANAPHVRGIAADITPGREAFGSVAGKFGMGFTVPGESWHIQWGGKGGGLSKPPKPKIARALVGGKGGLHQLGQAAADKAWHAAQNFADKKWKEKARGGFVGLARGGSLKELKGNITNFKDAGYRYDLAQLKYQSDESFMSSQDNGKQIDAKRRKYELDVLIADQRKMLSQARRAFRQAVRGVELIKIYGKKKLGKKDKEKFASYRESGSEFKRYIAQNSPRQLEQDLRNMLTERGKIAKNPALYNQDQSGLVGLLEQQNTGYAGALFGIGNQMNVLGGFGGDIANRFVGSFAHGGPVPQTGMALVHRGEYILPDPRGGYKASAAGSAAPTIVVHVHGDAGAVVDRITAEVDGRVARVVSEESGRRTRVLAAGGPRARSAYGNLAR